MSSRAQLINALMDTRLSRLELTEDDTLLSHLDLVKMELNIFGKYLESLSGDYVFNMQFFYRLNEYTLSEDGLRRITYSDAVNKLYRKYLTTNNFVFKNYLKNVIFPKYSPPQLFSYLILGWKVCGEIGISLKKS